MNTQLTRNDSRCEGEQALYKPKLTASEIKDALEKEGALKAAA